MNVPIIDKGQKLLAIVMLATVMSTGYVIGIFIGHATKVITGLYFLPLIASLALMAIAGLACKERKR